MNNQTITDVAGTYSKREISAHQRQGIFPVPFRRGNAERGVALIMVMILSAVSLALITTLLYMVTVGTQASGMHKKYRTALEAALAGKDLVYQIIDKRSDNTGINTLLNSWQTNYVPSSKNASIFTNTLDPSDCYGVASGSGTNVPYFDVAVKNMASSGTWNSCGSTVLGADKNDYDFMFKIGDTPQFTVYAKIVNTREGNTADDGTGSKKARIALAPVVGGGGSGGDIETAGIPYLYTIEVDAENTSNPNERAKLSVLYQY